MAMGAVRRASKRARNAEQLAERKRACMHALLNRPWVAKEDDPDLYFTVKDHYEELRDWLMDKAGFPLIVTRTIAKLDKTPVKAYPWMGFTEFREKRDYIFFTYGLWYLEGKTELDQFLLSDIVEEIREQMVSEGIDADWRNYYDRLAMARALKKLRSLGVLYSVDGDESHWAQDAGRNALYECSPNARYVLRRFPRDLTGCSQLEDLEDPIPYANTQDGQSMRRRHRVYRRLLLEPVVADRTVGRGGFELCTVAAAGDYRSIGKNVRLGRPALPGGTAVLSPGIDRRERIVSNAVGGVRFGAVSSRRSPQAVIRR